MDVMPLLILIILWGSIALLTVNGNDMVLIELKIMNARCQGNSCNNYRFKICHAGKGFTMFTYKNCLRVLDYTSVVETFYRNFATTSNMTYFAIPQDTLPSMFIMYIENNKEEILYQSSRHQNGTSLSLYFHQNNQSFVDIELTSKCFHASTCTGFMCKRCYPQAPTVTVPHSWTGAIGEIISIPCNISQLDEYTSIQWLKHNGSVNNTIPILESGRFSGGTFKSPGLKIVSAQQQDEGNYSCHAKNFKKEGSSHFVCLRIFEHPSVNITYIDPVVEGTNVTIQCYVSPSSEVINITWDRNNSTLDIQGNDRYDGGTISSPSLEIYFVQENDDGNYTCKAVNPVGIGKSLPIRLQVLRDIPKVHISRIEAVTVGENVIIPCNISSVSELTKVVWYKDSIAFNLNANRTEEDNRFSKGTLQDPSLTIYSVQMTDEGNYTCNATNAAEQTGWNKPVPLTVFEATTESLPTTDLIFTTSELSTPSSDIISTDFISPTSDLTTLISDTMPSTIETTNPNTVSSSVQTTIATNSANVPSTIETTKPSTVPSSIKPLATTSTHVPSTKYSYSSSTRKPFDTASSTLTPTRKSTTTLFNSNPTNTVTSTVRPTTKHMSVSSSYNLPKHTTESKPPTQISYSSSTVKTSTTTSSTVDISTKTSSTSDSPVTSASAVGSAQNSENLNAWVITTTVICVVEFIVIVLVIYIMWLRKQRRLAMQYEKEETAF